MERQSLEKEMHPENGGTSKKVSKNEEGRIRGRWKTWGEQRERWYKEKEELRDKALLRNRKREEKKYQTTPESAYCLPLNPLQKIIQGVAEDACRFLCETVRPTLKTVDRERHGEGYKILQLIYLFCYFLNNVFIKNCIFSDQNILISTCKTKNLCQLTYYASSTHFPPRYYHMHWQKKQNRFSNGQSNIKEKVLI